MPESPLPPRARSSTTTITATIRFATSAATKSITPAANPHLSDLIVSQHLSLVITSAACKVNPMALCTGTLLDPC
jgi:hypothetical protein